MINCENLAQIFKSNNLTFFTGVPCSILKDLLNYIEEDKDFQHVGASSEGEACAIATGYHLGTGKFPIIYMQNSGLGNSVDPLTSLMNKEVYSVPALLLITWRGEPDKKDAPQHLMMGKITEKLLEILGIPYVILSSTETEVEREVERARKSLEKNSLSYAFIIRKEIIAPYQKTEDAYLNREQAIKTIVDNLESNEVVVTTTGKTSRELWEIREAKSQAYQTDFYTLGSMGCAAGIALGIALQKPEKKVFVFDGDGSVLMKMGSLATIGHYLPENFYHIVFDNNSHDSTGGQKTVSDTTDFAKVALACGYRAAKVVSLEKELTDSVQQIKLQKGPLMIIVKVKKGARSDLGRPTTTPLENKRAFMQFLAKREKL